MKRRNLAIVWIGLGSWLMGVYPLAAQEPDPIPPVLEVEGLPEEPYEYAYGFVKEKKTGELILSEYVLETGLNQEVIYQVDPQVQVNNLSSFDELKAGDPVDVEYLIRDGKKVAIAISLEQPLEEILDGGENT